MISSVAIVGGTHGNETSGIQLVRNWREYGLPHHYGSLSLSLHLANEAAIKANTRFVEDDLNRQFSFERLLAADTSLEARLAKALNNTLGPKGDAKNDLVIDIHNTTSNMGATLIILEADEFHISMARFVKKAMPEANILLEDEVTPAEHPYLCTVGKRGVMVEVGAQPQGVLREDVFQLAQTMTCAVLDFCQAWNEGTLDDLPECDAFRLGHNVLYPMDDNGNRKAMIHHQFQDADFLPLLPGSPVFRYFDGTDGVWEKEDVTYPHFINEAAYHKLNVAFATSTAIKL